MPWPRGNTGPGKREEKSNLTHTWVEVESKCVSAPRGACVFYIEKLESLPI
jgi:hypothetical protein